MTSALTALVTLLGSEAFRNLIASAALAGVGIYTAYRQKATAGASQREAALLALRAGVEAAYQQYARQAKAEGSPSSPAGSLSLPEQAAARTVAKDEAQKAGATVGVDVAATLGSANLDVLIADFVKMMKR